MKCLYFALAIAATILGVSGEKHECERQCVAGDTRTCMYEFNIIEYHSLSRACYDCPNTLADCERPECIAADGVSRPIVTVNRQLPGPAIQVCEGDRVIVDVLNSQVSDTDSIHWHGQHMRDHQYYDGVPFVTQCPLIGPFRYDFPAATIGTHWWHSHSGIHREAGIFGALVVRQAEDLLVDTYDVDSPDHVLILHEWAHKGTEHTYWGYQHSKTSNAPDTILVNGKGRNSHSAPEGGAVTETPMEVVGVSPGLRHRLRLISASSFACPMIVSIDEHRFSVIASDGAEVTPREVDSLEISSGERFDIVVEANQAVGNYWIRFNGLVSCSSTMAIQGAILRYDGAPEELPPHTLRYDSVAPGTVLNPISPGRQDEVTLMELDAVVGSSLPEVVDKQFHIFLHSNAVNNTNMFNPELYPYNAVSPEWQKKSPQINNLSFKFPFAPPLTQPGDVGPSICRYHEDATPFCEGDFCHCTYVLDVALGDTVEMVLLSQGTHPFHLHGYTFHVVASGVIGSGTTMQDVIDLDNSGGITRKLENPLLKDTVMVPNGGYVIIRITADNPGWWIMHCHFMYHSEMGMAALLHVGEDSDLPPVPEGFPKCGAFMPSV